MSLPDFVEHIVYAVAAAEAETSGLRSSAKANPWDGKHVGSTLFQLLCPLCPIPHHQCQPPTPQPSVVVVQSPPQYVGRPTSGGGGDQCGVLL